MAYQLFEVVGVELEYMIVDDTTLDVRPIADELLKTIAGGYEQEAFPDGEDGDVSWSNELALHVIEFKTPKPTDDLIDIQAAFQRHAELANQKLRPMGCRLLPTAMHPWMDPFASLKLWPHHDSAIYEAFNKIFDCRGHGWANLQSAHINLPFDGDEQFGPLHAAIRAVLPLIPALAASSPAMDAHLTGASDNRLLVYKDNAKAIPSISGMVIPEPLYTQADYQTHLLEKLYADIAPHDPDQLLQEEWLNARGAIARFDRGSIEIRVLDIQECPAADIAVIQLVVETVKALTEGRWLDIDALKALDTIALAETLTQTIAKGEQATIADKQLLKAFGQSQPMTAAALWQALSQALIAHDAPTRRHLDVIFQHGNLSTRIRQALGDAPSAETFKHVYRQLAHCLDTGASFVPSSK